MIFNEDSFNNINFHKVFKLSLITLYYAQVRCVCWNPLYLDVILVTRLARYGTSLDLQASRNRHLEKYRIIVLIQKELVFISNSVMVHITINKLLPKLLNQVYLFVGSKTLDNLQKNFVYCIGGIISIHLVSENVKSNQREQLIF